MSEVKTFTNLDEIIERTKKLGYLNFEQQLEATKEAGYELVKRGNIRPLLARLENLSESERACVYYIFEILPKSGFNTPSVVEIRQRLLKRKQTNDTPDP